jgi:hypothetical protein
VDIFGFIGTSKAADEIQKAHPTPHRLRVCLGLEAKNPAIIFPDADLSVAIPECVTGSTSFKFDIQIQFNYITTDTYLLYSPRIADRDALL